MKKTKQPNDLSDIKFTLSYGHFEGASRKKIFIAFSILVIVLVSVMILAIVMVSIEQVHTPKAIGEFVGLVIGLVAAFLLLPLIWLIIIIKNEIIRKRIIMWKDDAVTINAYARNIGTKFWLGVPLIKLQVEFELDGVKYVRTTEEEHRGILDCGRPIGYFSGIAKFSNKNIQILYSPMFNEIMILDF